MTNDNNKPGAEAPGETKLVRRPGEPEPSFVTSADPKSEAHLGQSRPSKRQAEAVVDPRLNDTTPRSRTQTLIAVLPPEAVVRLVLFAGRMARKQGKRLPQNIEERLGEARARGDAAAPALRDWAIRIGVLADGPAVTPAGTRDTDPGLVGSDRATEHDRATMRTVMLARHLRERLGVGRSALRVRAKRTASRGSHPSSMSDSGNASPTVSDDPRRRS